jgi:hypothetical protein
MTRTEKTRALKDLATDLIPALKAAGMTYTPRHYTEGNQPALDLDGPPGSPSFELSLTDAGVVDVTVRGADPRPAGYGFTASRFGTFVPMIVGLATRKRDGWDATCNHLEARSNRPY